MLIRLCILPVVRLAWLQSHRPSSEGRNLAIKLAAASLAAVVGFLNGKTNVHLMARV